MRILLTIIALFLIKTSTAQSAKEYKSWNPETATIKALEGQAWPDKVKDC